MFVNLGVAIKFIRFHHGKVEGCHMMKWRDCYQIIAGMMSGVSLVNRSTVSQVLWAGALSCWNTLNSGSWRISGRSFCIRRSSLWFWPLNFTLGSMKWMPVVPIAVTPTDTIKEWLKVGCICNRRVAATCFFRVPTGAYTGHSCCMLHYFVLIRGSFFMPKTA